jgi:hypothetical protein
MCLTAGWTATKFIMPLNLQKIMNYKQLATVLISLAMIVSSFGSGIAITHAQASSPNAIFVSTTGSNVTGNGSAVNPYATISYAISKAAPYSIIEVYPGVYYGTVNITKPVILESNNLDPADTIINALNQTSGIEVIGGNSNGTEINGFTVEYADTSGIYVQNSFDVLIENNIVTSNSILPNSNAMRNFAVELVGTSNSTVFSNQVIGNVNSGGIGIFDLGQYNSGSISMGVRSPAAGNIISGNTVMNNYGGQGILVASYNHERVTGNVIENNYVVSDNLEGIAISADMNGSMAIRNQIIGNTVLRNGGGGISLLSYGTDSVIAHTIIENNFIAQNNGTEYHKAAGIFLGASLDKSSKVNDTTISGNRIYQEDFGILVSNATNVHVLDDNAYEDVVVPLQGATAVKTVAIDDINLLNSEIASLNSSVLGIKSSSTSAISNLSATVSDLMAEVNSLKGQESASYIISIAAIIIAIIFGLIAILLAIRRK